MKTRWIVLGAVLLALHVSAQDSAYYEELRYRKDDPFVFCTYGQKSEGKCWVPTDHLGAWMYNLPAYCDPPYYPYGKSWTQEDYDSLDQYISTCPHAESDGSWKGQGDPQNTPENH